MKIMMIVVAFVGAVFAASSEVPAQQSHFLAAAVEQPQQAPLTMVAYQQPIKKAKKVVDRYAVCTFNWETYEWECGPDPEPEPDCHQHPELCW